MWDLWEHSLNVFLVLVCLEMGSKEEVGSWTFNGDGKRKGKERVRARVAGQDIRDEDRDSGGRRLLGKDQIFDALP